MSLTPYVQASTMFTMNNEVADRQALAVEQMFSTDYHLAKRNYKLGHERFNSRAALPPPPIPDDEDATYAIETYTCCLTPEMPGYYDRSTYPDTRGVDRELMERAQQRRQEDLTRRAKGNRAARRRENPLTMLLEREKDEYEDIVDIEAAHFKRLAKEYYDSTFAELDFFVHMEWQARQTLEDIEASVAMGLLARLRELIEEAERRLIVRSTALYPDHFPRKRIGGNTAQEEEEEVKVLDSMYAVPLWQRVLAIREETKSEEDITFRNTLLGYVTQRDLISRGFLRVNPSNGMLMRDEEVTIPYQLKEAVAYAFKMERLTVEVEEENDRMDIIDEAMEVTDQLLEEWVLAVREDNI